MAKAPITAGKLASNAFEKLNIRITLVKMEKARIRKSKIIGLYRLFEKEGDRIDELLKS